MGQDRARLGERIKPQVMSRRVGVSRMSAIHRQTPAVGHRSVGCARERMRKGWSHVHVMFIQSPPAARPLVSEDTVTALLEDSDEAVPRSPGFASPESGGAPPPARGHSTL